MVLNQTMNRIELFQFIFKTVSYGLIFFSSIQFSLMVQFGFLFFCPPLIQSYTSPLSPCSICPLV
jgi:hypothetical protein